MIRKRQILHGHRAARDRPYAHAKLDQRLYLNPCRSMTVSTKFGDVLFLGSDFGSFGTCRSHRGPVVPGSSSGRQQSQTERSRQFGQLCGIGGRRTFRNGQEILL